MGSPYVSCGKCHDGEGNCLIKIINIYLFSLSLFADHTKHLETILFTSTGRQLLPFFSLIKLFFSYEIAFFGVGPTSRVWKMS